MVKRFAACLLTATLPNLIAAAHATPADCSGRLLPSSPGTATGPRAIEARDLVELRDFGRAEGAGEAFTLSPDGRFAALTLRRADVASDTYCIAVILVPTNGHGTPTLLDLGGEPILGTNDVFGIPAIISGVVRPGTPIWSPDGKSLAYLRRDNGITQVWQVRPDGAPARQLTHLSSDALTLAWSADGRSLLFTTRASVEAARAEIAREEPNGFLYDDRFWLSSDTRPHPRLPLPVEQNVLDLASGAVRIVAASEAQALSKPTGPGDAELFATSSSGNMAWTALADAARPFGPSKLHIEVRGKNIVCAGDPCGDRIGGLWWRGPDELILMRSPTAANGGRTAFYRWRIGAEPAPVRLFDTIDLFASCQLTNRAMVCAREAATSPRAIVRLNLDTGRAEMVFDPNPEFSGIALGKSTRLRWVDDGGIQSFADLVFPPSHKPGEKHPLVVIQYLSRGFLRGGTGDEYPIQLLAAHGFAVLSFQKPEPLPAMLDAPDVDSAQRINVTGWAERRRIFRSLDAGIDAAIATGSVDSGRIGITGFSDGEGTVQFALNNSSRFKAAAISSCCDEPGVMFALGPSYAASGARWGYPIAGADGRAYWKPQSLALNADRVRVPLLMQLPDSEVRGAAETFAALKGHGAPVEMYVFANEHHIKIGPVHRLTIYQRSVAWFDFWLRGVRSADPRRREEIGRWETMRVRLAD